MRARAGVVSGRGKGRDRGRGSGACEGKSKSKGMGYGVRVRVCICVVVAVGFKVWRRWQVEGVKSAASAVQSWFGGSLGQTAAAIEGVIKGAPLSQTAAGVRSCSV